MKNMKSLISLILILLLNAMPACATKSTVQQLLERGDSCRLEWKYNKALTFYNLAYQDPDIANDTEMQFELLERIMRCHDVLRHWKEMPETSYRLYMLGKEHGDSMRMAQALFMKGKRLHAIGKKKEGMDICMNAIEILKRTDYGHKNHELANLYGLVARMHALDGQYEEALRMSELHENYVELAKKKHTAAWYERDMTRVRIIRMETLELMGRTAEADSIFQQYQLTIQTDPICGDALLQYYHQNKMYEREQEFYQAALKNIREDGDTIGRNMQRLLHAMANLCNEMGRNDEAVRYYQEVANLADTLAARSLVDLGAEVRKVINSEREIARQRMITTIIIAVIVLLIVITLLMIYISIMTHRKNKRMTEMTQKMMHYREIVIQNGDPDETEENETSKVSKEEMKRFEEVDKRIMKERLFANPDFGRDDLMRLFGVDKNNLPGVLSRYANTNVSGYVNIKRMEYAVELMKQHSEYTLAAIAEACGIKSPATFIRNFRNTYGMSPSEFRKNIDEGVGTSRKLTFDNESMA